MRVHVFRGIGGAVTLYEAGTRPTDRDGNVFNQGSDVYVGDAEIMLLDKNGVEKLGENPNEEDPE